MPAKKESQDEDKEPAFDKISKANKKVMFEKDVFEGDIRVTAAEREALESDGLGGHHNPDEVKFLNRRRRSSLVDTNKKWPNARVPYEFDPALNIEARNAILQAADEFARYTCVRLVPKTSADYDYVYFADYGGCWSYIGRTGLGAQTVSIGQGCEWKQVVLHEVLHALGYFHEQSRNDRDDFVTILYSNIVAGMESNFAIHSAVTASAFGFPYNKQGIMHYSNYAFSANSLQTIISNSDANEELGGAMGLTQGDIDQINAYYGCSAATTTPRPSTTTSTTQPPTTTTTTQPPTTTTTTKPPTTTTSTQPPITTTTTQPSTTTTTTQPPTTTTTTQPPTTTATTKPPTTTTTTQPPTTTTTQPPTTTTTTQSPTTTTTTQPPTTTTTTQPPATTTSTQPSTAASTMQPPVTTTSSTTSRPPTTTPTTTQPTSAPTSMQLTTSAAKAMACTQLDTVGYEWHCARYAEVGYCGTSSWMFINCKRTCCLKV